MSMNTQRIKVNGHIIELTTCCHWGVIDGILHNYNTGLDEGVEGDIVEYSCGNKWYKGHVKGYTCHQWITTEEWGSVCLSAKECPPLITHKTKVELIKD